MKTTTLNVKLARELWRARAQIAAIALVIVGGLGTWVIAFSSIDSLELMRSSYYREYRFADVFASVVRAPEAAAGELREIPGVRTLATRVKTLATASVASFDEPVSVELVSIPDHSAPELNAIHLRQGRLPEHLSADEIVISEPFAIAHRLTPGDRIALTVNGRRRDVAIVGIGLSPEYVYQIQPGVLFPDHERFAIAWMRRHPLASALDMDGAFNDVVFRLEPGADEAAAIDAIDRVVTRFGGVGAYARDDQTSHQFLDAEITQLRSFALIVPVIFLAVAAFLIHLVMARLIGRQREVIALLKAFGYGNRAIAVHYLALVAAVVLIGAVPGTAVGAWAGGALSSTYGEFFNFPFLHYHLEPSVPLGGTAFALAIALVGAYGSIRDAVAMPAAEAMRPQPPASYRATVLERLGMQRLFDQPTRMILRHLERQPGKAALSVLGIAMAGAIVMVGNGQLDAVDFMVAGQFRHAQREDLTVTFIQPSERAAANELAHLPGVAAVEPFRAVGARLHADHRSVRSSIIGLAATRDLHRLLDEDLRPIAIPEHGLVLSRWLADELRLGVGDTVLVETLEGRRQWRDAVVAGVVREYVGSSAYMDIEALNRMMLEGSLVSGAFVAADDPDPIYTSLKDRPRVAGVSLRSSAMQAFEQTHAEVVVIFAVVVTLLAGSIAFGVVYNAARIAFAERARELATLRVVGFTRAEITYILVGELALLALAAIPLALVLGRWLIALISENMSTEMYSIPVAIQPDTYVASALLIVGATILSCVLVAWRLRRLDLVAVLKTRE